MLVAGASGFLGNSLVARLARNPDVERVVAVDNRIPNKDLMRRMGRAEFVRADIRNPMIRKVIDDNEVDTVVHAGLMSRPPSGGSRAAMKDLNVLGAMQLFAVCQKAPSLRKVVLRSASAVYGGDPKDPAKFTEEMGARKRPSGAFARDAIEVEGYLRGLARRRPDLITSTLRLSPIIGPGLAARVGRYLRLPMTPTVLGRDARLQLLHEQDAYSALETATLAGPSGTFNVAGDGVLPLSQAIARSGRVEMPLPYTVFRGVGRALMGPMMREFADEQLDYFRYGCVLDTTRMRTELGFQPRWTTLQAFDDFVRGAGLRPVLDPELVTAVETRLRGLIGA
ncbi:MAG: NAD-dependent epimerase/dehydratase family protein [Mycobacteriaceae bacterium]|nr:NAD-dependent epimerase/dehydratase family protein [Mycobacteriaceae bacterium]